MEGNRIQSRYLLWFNREKLTKKVSVKKPLIIQQKKINTFIVFEICKSSSSKDVEVSLADESKELLKTLDLTCRCVFYDYVTCSTYQDVGHGRRTSGYFGSLVEIKILNGRECKEFSKVEFEKDYIYDRSTKRINRIMKDQTYFHIPLLPSTQPSTFTKKLSDEYVFKFRSSTISVLSGQYSLPADFSKYLKANNKVAFVSVLKQATYTFKHFDQRFELSYGINPKSKPRYDGYLLAIHIREVKEDGDLEKEKQKAWESLLENEINYVESALCKYKSALQKERDEWTFEKFKHKMETFFLKTIFR